MLANASLPFTRYASFLVGVPVEDLAKLRPFSRLGNGADRSRSFDADDAVSLSRQSAVQPFRFGPAYQCMDDIPDEFYKNLTEAVEQTLFASDLVQHAVWDHHAATVQIIEPPYCGRAAASSILFRGGDQ